MGYHRAGFDVVGVDIDPQPRYPFEFHQADALEYAAEHWQEFDAIHASPPCQAYSTITPDKSKHPELIEPTRELLMQTGLPYVIENVAGAREHLKSPMLLCGSAFGLKVRRHRYFESNVWLSSLPCDHAAQGTPVGVYGDHWDSKEHLRPDGSRRGAKATSLADGYEAMGIDWMTWHELAEAIPPAFTELIGQQLLTAIQKEAA
jgi:DNA (cytosine-5)-methyltransferase 1